MQSRVLCSGSAAAVAARRLRNILGPIAGKGGGGSRGRCFLQHEVKHINTSSGDIIKIGDITYHVKKPKNPELVPLNYTSEELPQSIAQHLRWIMQKDLLGQDVFLIGPPGPLRRSIAMQYLELTKREVEYVALSRDTTETDLKQRREIRDGTAFYVDQCAVRAATEGRVLVLEGLEKAERNVLPVLNNLLENREMQLEDGRFLTSSHRYDKLLKEHTKEELDAWKIVRVSEDFRVIALGLPVPRYTGNPLDPPLRSRFQARDIYYLPFKDELKVLYDTGPNVAAERVMQLLSFATTLCSQESASLGLPDFPVDSLAAIVKILNVCTLISSQQMIQRLYPYDLLLGKDGRMAVENALSKFELLDAHKLSVSMSTVKVEKNCGQLSFQAAVTVQIANKRVTFQVPAGTRPLRSLTGSLSFIKTDSHDHLLAEIIQSHMVKDMCLIGAKGCGKSVIVKEFAEILGYKIEPIMLYQDMTARDLLQQRYTLPNGDTSWRPSPLVTAAQEGKLVVLDGIHRVNLGTLSVLSRLIHDREIALYDGTRLIPADRYQSLKEVHKLTDEDMQKRSVFPVHPSFRIIALAEPPVIGSSTQQWLSPEMLTMFLFHSIKPLTMKEEKEIINGMTPNVSEDAVEKLLNLTHKLRQTKDSTAQSLASSLSTRQLLRICQRLSQYPEENIAHAINKACLSRFLPNLARSALQKNLLDSRIEETVERLSKQEEVHSSHEIKGGTLKIGKVSIPVYDPDEKMKVPDVLFYENAQHMMIMEDMLKDFLLGEHLLLVGNQGVGKNKIADRFLHLLNRPREYLQLHRDTTVQTLTLQPSVRDGIIVYEDSPLVKAVKMGHVLVIDEADKAPTNVTCILKTLVENGEMILADGRRIVADQAYAEGRPEVIVMHPDFRMLVLANRPGFPFLGNDFFGALGDIFSCHAVDNPKPQSELAMLKQYGPDVPEAVLQKLVAAFGELRGMADQGTITYPYSTREVVNIVRHLQKFPDEGLSDVVRNVFDFDSYNKDMRDIVIGTLHKHGIPIGAKPTSVHLAKELPLPDCHLTGYWTTNVSGISPPKLLCPAETRHIDIKGPIFLRIQKHPLERKESRALSFTEEQAHWQIPMNEVNIVCDIITADDTIYVATCNPVSLYSMNRRGGAVHCMDLYDVFPRTVSGIWQPFITLGALGHPLENQVVVHEEQSNAVLHVDLQSGAVRQLLLSQDMQGSAKKVSSWWANKEDKGVHKMCREFSHMNWLVFYKEGGCHLDVLDVLEGKVHTISLPINLGSVYLVAEDRWLLIEHKTNQKFLLTKPTRLEGETSSSCQLHKITEDPVSTGFGMISGMQCSVPHEISKDHLSSENLSAALGQKIVCPNRILSDVDNYATIVIGFPDLMSPNEVYSWKRKSPLTGSSSADKFFAGGHPNAGLKRSNCVILLGSNQVIRALPSGDVPLSDVYTKDAKPELTVSYLEITDLNSKKVKYIAIPSPSSLSPYTSWLSKISDTDVLLAALGHGSVITVDMGGHMRLWETGLESLQRSLLEWRNMIGREDGRPVQITVQKDSGLDVSSPKHGKVDANNVPHVGGNMWAGGTGGRDTAGLGGKGGPYRLDAGHQVYQVSQAEKDAVPEEVKRAAREMAEKAFKERLQEIPYSGYGLVRYRRWTTALQRQLHSIRSLIHNLIAKGKERQWLKNQAVGELDDAKIIDGLTGEKNIYKRRGEKDPELGTPQQKPKRLQVLVDISGSMYRFNGVDGRLERSMEAVCMVMEALEGYEQKLKYDILGHSGDGFNIELVRCDKIPKNNKQRLEVLKIMHAHSQFCMSGDYTLEGTEHAVKEIVKEEADEYFVIVLSDANLERYGISPSRFAQALTTNSQVNAFAIFIGSLGDQAERLQKTLPAGRSFVAMDTKQIPQILQQIFTSTMLSSA
ncbi:von Willebrand factor A domain-containing protein 8 [Erpetoichthys calabaricus]|uniref:von Willebrand factor A domain-containing protein 8 n=1 Tax=Erpetoichthys calabaricus TaxID=27687 RepID=UPI002234B910|nr:von Willebrand factor A domain-containing protein 8 [Erpetoichthys calabaricus]